MLDSGASCNIVDNEIFKAIEIYIIRAYFC